MAFFESSEEVMAKERERIRKQDEENRLIASEIVAMGREYVAALTELGVVPDRPGGFYWVDNSQGSYFVDSEGAYRVQEKESGSNVGSPRPFEPYRPGMFSLAGFRDELRGHMARRLTETAHKRVRLESQEG